MSPYQSVILEMKSRETPLAADLITVLLLPRDTISKSTVEVWNWGLAYSFKYESMTIIGGTWRGEAELAQGQQLRVYIWIRSMRQSIKDTRPGVSFWNLKAHPYSSVTHILNKARPLNLSKPSNPWTHGAILIQTYYPMTEFISRRKSVEYRF